MIGSVFSIPLLLDSVGEETVNDMLQTFSCAFEGAQLDEEVEKFVRNSSIEFCKRKISVTYLVNDEDDRLAGIFTLTHKAIDIPSEGMTAILDAHRAASTILKTATSGIPQKTGVPLGPIQFGFDSVAEKRNI